jgi:diacylglycerol kinase (ATP)
MPNLSIIYNPLAGTANLASVMKQMTLFWQDRGWRVTIKPTQFAGHARELALSSAAEGHEMILAAGGDGTLGEVAGGLAFTDAIMAPFPAGTGNSFAKELEMPRLGLLSRNGVVRACEALYDGRVHSIDIGRSGDEQFWLQWLGVGIDSYVVEHIEPRSKIVRRFGRIGYLGEGLPHIKKFPGMRAKITVDDEQIEGDFLMAVISNCRRYAGGQFLLSPRALIDDGKMEVWLFKGTKPAALFRYMLAISRQRHLRDSNILFFKAESVTVESEPALPYHRDGDPAGSTPVTTRIEARALKFLVPTTAPKDIFSKPGSLLVDLLGK